MAKNLTCAMLLDFYGELLTQKQQMALELYYNQDLSLAEIAEEMTVSRQGVRAFIKQGETHLQEFEEKLNLVERFSQISKITAEMKQILSDMPKDAKIKELKIKIGEMESRL